MNALDAAIKSVLSADTGIGGVATLATGGIYQLEAPQGTVPPYVVFQELTDMASYTFTLLAFDHVYYQIKAFAVDANFSGPFTSGQIADQLKALLTDPGLTVTGKSVLYCRFDRALPPMKERDEANNRWVYSRGGIFEIWLT